ncbi:MAG: phage major capsid protein [Chloroflexi bacterium]|nr:phage major capsid protein [Chloroflexota bacterium]
MGVSLTTENILRALRATEQEAAVAYAAAAKLRADMEASGADPLAEANFEKLDVAFKAYDVKAQEAEGLKEKLALAQGWDGTRAPASARLPIPDGPGASHVDSIFQFGARVTEHESYRAAQKLALSIGDAQFSQMSDVFRAGIPLMSRAETQRMLYGRGGFAATAITGGSATSAGPFIQNDLQPGFVEYVRKTPTLAAVVGRAETDSDVVEYVTQSAPTNNAAETAEANNAPESVYPFATATVNVQEFVHYVPITRRAMADAGQMRSIVEGELVLDVVDRLDTQIANGAGTGDEIEGIYTAVTQAQARGSDARPDAIHKGITKVRIAAGVRMEPDYIGIHPNDYQDLILETDASGRYLMGDPNLQGPRTIWGIPFIVSTVFTDGTPLVGNFARGARLWMRSGIEVLSGLNDDDFVKRRISLMATMRAAFKTIRPTAFTEVTGF